MANPPSGTVTFLFTDIEGSTAMWENHPLQMESALARHDGILKYAVEGHRGYVFKTVGDAFCAAFATAREALEAALAAQRALSGEDWDESCRIQVRMALHTGAANERDGDYFGTAVNRVARLLSAGHGGQVLLSAVTYGLARDDLRHTEPGAELRYLGEHRLRDLKHTERVFQLVAPDLSREFPPLRTYGLVGDETTDERPPEPAGQSAAATPPEDPSGDERYRRVRPIGSGGMAEVYLARDEVLDRDVALKVLRRQYADDPRFVERFMREARNAASLSHPNIVAVYDRGRTEGGENYIVMEYVEGGTLKDLIEREGPLPTDRAASITVQVARALEVAHERGIVHRDIKPQNILLDRLGEAKVSDFGIAHAAALTRVTVEGSVLGTAHYVSPEQAMGGEVSPRSDLYSLGVTLYEMLTGEVPHDADTPLGIVMQHVSGQPRAPKEVDPSIPDGLNAAVVRLLAKDPADRYPSAAALIEDLERERRGEPGTDRQATGPTREAAPGLQGPEGERPRQAPVRRSPPSRNKKVLLLAGVMGVLLVLLLSGGALALASFGPGIGLLGGEPERLPNNEDPPPAGSPDDPANTPASPDTTASEDPDATTPASPPASGRQSSPQEPAEREEEVRAATEDYYLAVDREDWDYTYANLASQTQGQFDEAEWRQKNQWFVGSDPVQLDSMDVTVSELAASALVADVTVDRTFADGSAIVRDTRFVYEGGVWKHLFVQEEIDAFMPDATYEEFVAAYDEGGSSAPDEQTAVEDAVREHYEAIGEGDFQEAYTYFGPGMRDQAGGEQYWIQGEEESEITASTVNSVEVDEVSGETATATVDVQFEDETGTPRFLITWNLILENGSWKLENQLSAERPE